MSYRAKDFVQVAADLLFAVVADGLEQGKVLCFLRYVRQNGIWHKLDTEQANNYLLEHHPAFLYYSNTLDARLHAVDAESITRHFQPRQVLQQLLDSKPADPVIADLQALCGLLAANHLSLEQLGVTGSILVGTQKHTSDIDLVCYDRAGFQRARSIIQFLISKDQCQTLNDADWLSAYQRRACDFALDDYIWHEQRKYNKAIFNQRKFDLSLLCSSPVNKQRQFRKAGFVRIQAEVLEDAYGFDYPALFEINHPHIKQVVCFTATYTGQARKGESIEVAGQLEMDDQGRQRIVVGSNREALGEFIKVIR